MILKKTLQKLAQHKPRMYSESLVLNILGMQIWRIFFLYIRRIGRMPQKVSPQYTEYLKKLTHDGFVAIPNFLSPEDYEHVKNEFHNLSPQFAIDPSEIALPRVRRMSVRDQRVSQKIKKIFLNNPTVQGTALAFLNRPYNLRPDALLTSISCNQEELSLPQNGGTNNIHFDAPARTLKTFYYVTDTNEDNAAFYYCIGSHKRNSLKRLLFEYRLSIRYALNRWNPNTKGEYLANEPWVKITAEELKKYNLHETAVSVKGNTMVLADIGGFHRRGEFRKPGVRETIEINFRSIDTPRNVLYPLEQKIKALLQKKTPLPA